MIVVAGGYWQMSVHIKNGRDISIFDDGVRAMHESSRIEPNRRMQFFFCFWPISLFAIAARHWAPIRIHAVLNNFQIDFPIELFTLENWENAGSVFDHRPLTLTK